MTIFIIIGSITIIALLWFITAAEESIVNAYSPVRDTHGRVEQEQEVAHVETHRPARAASLEPYTSRQTSL